MKSCRLAGHEYPKGSSRFTSFISLVITAAVLSVTGCVAKQPSTIRVLTYNIHHGEGMDAEIDLERIANVIQRTKADLVALQEVDRGVERTNQIDQPAKLAELTGMQAIFEKNIDYQGGEYGNAVLSRLPVERHKNHHLPKSLPNEQRGLLEVHVQCDGKKLIFLATHFDYHPDDGERMASVEVLRKFVEQHQDAPIIVAGDLNSAPKSRVMQETASFLQDSMGVTEEDGFTFPADKPNRRIDYILIDHKNQLRCVEHRVPTESVASDHRPVLAVFETE